MPIGPLIERIALRPLADASVLLLLIVSVALTFGLSGLGLLFFGAEGFRTKPLTNEMFRFGTVIVTAQTLLMVALRRRLQPAAVSVFRTHFPGQGAARDRHQPRGARIVGIRPASTGTLAFLLASLLGAISGVLIGPVTTMYYDSGFIIGLKAFVGAIIGGLVSYPGTALGAILVGVLESFASFWNIVVQGGGGVRPLIPVLLWRSLYAQVRGGRRGDRGMNRARRLLSLAVVAVAILAAAPLWAAPFTITLLNYIGISALVVLGIVLLTGVGGIDVVWPGGLRRHRRLRDSVADDGVRRFALAWASLCAGADRAVAALLGAVTLPARRPLPAARHHRLGHGDLLCVRQYRCARRQQRPLRRTADLGGSHLPRTHAGDLLPDLDRAGAGDAGGRQSPELREGRAIRSLRGGAVMVESLGIRLFRVRLITFVVAALLGGDFGLALCAHEPLVSPSPFDVHMGIEYLFMAILADRADLGAVVGLALLTMLTNALQDILPHFVQQRRTIAGHRVCDPLRTGAAICPRRRDAAGPEVFSRRSSRRPSPPQRSPCRDGKCQSRERRSWW